MSDGEETLKLTAHEHLRPILAEPEPPARRSKTAWPPKPNIGRVSVAFDGEGKPPGAY